MRKPIEILREKLFSGRRYGPQNYYTVPVSLFRVFETFLTDYVSLFEGHLVRVFKKKSSLFSPPFFFFFIAFLLRFARRALFKC